MMDLVGHGSSVLPRKCFTAEVFGSLNITVFAEPELSASGEGRLAAWGTGVKVGP